MVILKRKVARNLLPSFSSVRLMGLLAFINAESDDRHHNSLQKFQQKISLNKFAAFACLRLWFKAFFANELYHVYNALQHLLLLADLKYVKWHLKSNGH